LVSWWSSCETGSPSFASGWRGCSASELRSAAFELALELAREHALTDFELCTTDRVPSVGPEFGVVQLRRIPARKNRRAQGFAHRRLRQLAPLRGRDDGEFSLAEAGVDLEIQRLVEEAASSLSDSDD
jgi:hypothetical protein